VIEAVDGSGEDDVRACRAGLHRLDQSRDRRALAGVTIVRKMMKDHPSLYAQVVAAVMIAGDETPGPTHWMSVYDGHDGADPFYEDGVAFDDRRSPHLAGAMS
jgi:hypothetical protein